MSPTREASSKFESNGGVEVFLLFFSFQKDKQGGGQKRYLLFFSQIRLKHAEAQQHRSIWFTPPTIYMQNRWANNHRPRPPIISAKTKHVCWTESLASVPTPSPKNQIIQNSSQERALPTVSKGYREGENNRKTNKLPKSTTTDDKTHTVILQRTKRYDHHHRNKNWMPGKEQKDTTTIKQRNKKPSKQHI